MTVTYTAKPTDFSSIRIISINASSFNTTFRFSVSQKREIDVNRLCQKHEINKPFKTDSILALYRSQYNKQRIKYFIRDLMLGGIHHFFNKNNGVLGVDYKKDTLADPHAAILFIFKILEDIKSVKPCIDIEVENTQDNLAKLEQIFHDFQSEQLELIGEPEQTIRFLVKANHAQMQTVLSRITEVNLAVAYGLRIEIPPQEYNVAANVLRKLEQGGYISEEFCAEICREFPVCGFANDYSYTDITACCNLPPIPPRAAQPSTVRF